MLAAIFITIQVILLLYFCFFAFFNYRYSIASLKKPTFKTVKPSGKKVAIVIVSYNENIVLKDTIKACEKLTYKNKVIVVGDDSDDGITHEFLRDIAHKKHCRTLPAGSHNTSEFTEILESKDFILLHRHNNEGWKAGNLKELTAYFTKRGIEYMYLLDADWRPQIDAIERCLEVLEADPSIAFTQTKRLSYHGKRQSLQRCLGINEEGCYFVDLPGRQITGDGILFSGCCTMFQISHLRNVGGFHPGHLTEDIDLTNRFYLHGYKGVYLEHVANEGEVPSHYRAFRKQQQRWATGSARTFKEYTWKVLKSKKMNWKEKLGMVRQNAYFTTSVAIQLSIAMAFISILFVTLFPENFQAALYEHYLNKIATPYSILLFAALASNFVPLFITVYKKRMLKNVLFIPYATWVSWSALHTYFIANIRGFLGYEHIWDRTPKTNRKKIPLKPRRAYGITLANFVTLCTLLVIYWLEWSYFGWVDPYAFFWIPALTAGAVLG